MKNYFFVYNDRYQGAPAPVASALQKLKSDHKLLEAKVIEGGKLEEMFMGLSQDMRQIIIGGGVPECNLSFLILQMLVSF